MSLYYQDRNLKNIQQLADHTKIVALKWHEYLVTNDIDILIYETIRTESTQRENVRKGASQTMKSFHLVGQALDFVPVAEGGRTDWNGYKQPKIQQAIVEAKRLGFEWGGDWKSFVDRPHLQFNHKGYGTDTFGEIAIAGNSNQEQPKKVYFHAGGFSGESLSRIHYFLLTNKYWYEPSRKDDGTMIFHIGAFTKGNDSYETMKKFLDENKYWYEIK